MNLPYMPIFVADYLSETAHLNAAESGAYLLLLMHYWRRGKLPIEDKFLARIARMTDRQWLASKPTLREFFTEGWAHSRLENARAKALSKGEARAESGSRGGHAKALKSQDAGLAKASAAPEQTHKQNGGEALPSSSDIEDTTTVVSEKRAQERASFARFWTAWPHKVGKPTAERAFAKVAGEVDAILRGVDAYVRNKPPNRPWLNPATFLNQRRWEDAPAPAPPFRRRDGPPQHKPGRIETLVQAASEFTDDQPYETTHSPDL